MDPRARRLVALAALGALLLFSPVVGAFRSDAAVLGVPALPLYLHGVWGGLLLAARLLGPRRRR